MRKRFTLGLACAAVTLTAGILVIAGCGGGGSNPGTPLSPAADFTKLLPAGQAGATYVGNARCAECHGAIPKTLAAKTRSAAVQLAKTRAFQGTPPRIDLDAFNQTKHGQTGVKCEQCHGAGSNHVGWAVAFLQNPGGGNVADVANTILTYPNITRTEVCAQCHGPVTASYKASKHATAVSEVMADVQSNPAVYGKSCLRCHSAPMRTQLISYPLSRGVSPTDIDANINALSNDQLKAYASATVESPSCGSCHNPHMLTGKLVQRVGQAPADHQLFYSGANTDTSSIAPGTTIVQNATADQTCGTCHNGRGANPTDANLTTGTSRPSYHEGPQYSMLMGVSGYEGASIEGKTTAHATQNTAQCVQCHMPVKLGNGQASHEMVPDLSISCAPCHSQSDAQNRLETTQGEIQSALVGLKARLQNWSQNQFGRPDWWDYTALLPTGQAPTAAQEATVPMGVRRARHNYYFVLRDGSLGVHNAKYTRLLLNAASTELDPLVSRAANIGPAPTRAQMQSILRADIQRAKQSYATMKPSDL